MSHMDITDAKGGSPQKIRFILVDDERLIRDAVGSLLRLEEDLELVGLAASGEEALALATRLVPDVVVTDLQMPGMDGLTLVERLAAQVPSVRVAMVTSHGLPGYLKRALSLGVRAFLPKTSPAATLADAIRTIAAGGRYVDPELAAEAISSGDSPLTARETDVLTLAADGAPIEEIAQRASLSSGTVRNYLSSAVAKLGAANRHEAARIARSRGWL